MFPPSKRHQSPSRKSGTKKYVEKSSKVTVIMEYLGLNGMPQIKVFGV